MRYAEGAEVTIVPAETDPLIFHMQRHVTVERRVDRGYMLRFTDALPEVQGPVPEDRLLTGWVR
jgi:hypothetical protein